MRNPDQEVQQHLDALYLEKEHMSKEIYLLRETIKVSRSNVLKFIDLINKSFFIKLVFVTHFAGIRASN